MVSRWKRDAGIAGLAAGVGAGMHKYYVEFVKDRATATNDVGPGPSSETVVSTGPCSVSVSVHEAEKASAGASTFRFSPGRRRGGASPMLPLAISRPNDNLEIAFNTATKNPLYVLETFSRRDVQSKLSPRPGTAKGDPLDNASRNNKFHEESGLPWHFRSKNSHYRRSGYDRGHLAPAADFRDRHRDDSEERVRDTYNLCNVSPQVSSFNRGPWANLERAVRRIVDEELETGGGDDVSAIVITGPLFLPSEMVRSADDGGGSSINDKFRFSHFAIGRPPSLVTVPTHFFKVVAITEDRGERVQKIAAFVLPNVEDSRRPADRKLTGYLVTLADLETVTGMDFFPGMWGSNVEKKGSSDGDEWDNFGKDLADALTEDLLDRPSRPGQNPDVPVLLNSISLGNRKMRKIQKRIKEDEAARLRHLCEGGRCDR